MPTEVAPAAAGPTTRVRVSALLELQFCLFIIERSASQDVPRKWTQAWVAPFMDEHRELANRVARFWGDGAPPEWGELLIYADMAGVLFSEDLDSVWVRLEDAAARPVVVPPLPTETPEVRPLIQARADRLAASPELRANYFALLREVWRALEPAWREWGHTAANVLADHLRQDLPRHANPRELLPTDHFVRRDTGCGPAVSDQIDRGEMVIVPIGLGGVGYALFALPGVVLASFGPDAGNRMKLRRQVAEAAATRFKVLSDPTRNAILSALMQTSRTISQLAEVFELSQPTVSVHMKMLREADLLTVEKTKGQTLYSATAERVHAYIAEAERSLVVDCS